MATLAKLTRPRLHDLVPRQRLFALLDAARDRGTVAWVSGPPGSGKTALLASYLEARKPASDIWYQIDGGDNDLSTFFHYLTLALGSTAGRRHASLPHLTPEYLADVPGFIRRYSREFFGRVKRPATLTLDNYHELPANAALHAALELVIAEIPEGVMLVVISRFAPPAGLERLVASEGLARIDWDDLRLAPDEAFAIAASRHPVAAPSLRQLYDLSGGWAAGWMLGLERARRLGREPERLCGEAMDAMFNYFSAQILRASPPHTRDFLMRTALLPRFTAALAGELSGNTNAEELLDDLYRRGYFIDRRGVRPRSYQFHDLLRAFLLDQLQATLAPADLASLRRRAGELLEAAHLVDEAVPLFRDASDWEGVTRLVLDNAERLLGEGRGVTLRSWIDAMPEAQADRTPWLSYWLGMSLLPVAPAKARAALENSFHAFGGSAESLGQLLAGTGVIHSYRFEFERFAPVDSWIEKLDGTLRQVSSFPTPEMELQVNGALVFALSYRRPDPALLKPHVRRIEELLATATIAPDAVAASARILIQHYMVAFDFAAGRQLIERVRPMLAAAAPSAINLALWHTGQGFHHWWEGDIAAAADAFSTSQDLCESNGIVLPATRLYNLFGLALIAVDRSDPAGAEAYRLQAVRYADLRRGNDRLHDVIIRAKLARARSDWSTAIDLTGQVLELALEVGWQHLIRDAFIMCSLPLIETDRFDEAEHHIRNARSVAESNGGHRSSTDVALLEGYCALRRGNRRAWLDCIAGVIAQLRATGERLCLRESPTVMPTLLAAALDAEIETAYVCRLIRRYDVQPLDSRSRTWPWPIRVVTLGGFEVSVDGEPLEFSRKVPKKPLQLLKALVAFGGTGVPEQKVADALWPDDPGDAARSACGTTVLRLRRLLGEPAAILQAGGRLSLNPDLVWVDATAFGRACREAPGDDPIAAPATALYGGDFLPDDGDEPWTIATREKLRGAFVAAVSGLALRHEQAGHLGAAIDLYRRGIDADELVEDFYRGLMRCHRRSDERTEALNVYRRLQHTLARTLGIEPSPETVALAREIQAPALIVAGPAARGLQNLSR